MDTPKGVFLVAILILLELTLQLVYSIQIEKLKGSRNPYFIGINSAMTIMEHFKQLEIWSQSLFYWN